MVGNAYRGLSCIGHVKITVLKQLVTVVAQCNLTLEWKCV